MEMQSCSGETEFVSLLTSNSTWICALIFPARLPSLSHGLEEQLDHSGRRSCECSLSIADVLRKASCRRLPWRKHLALPALPALVLQELAGASSSKHGRMPSVPCPSQYSRISARFPDLAFLASQPAWKYPCDQEKIWSLSLTACGWATTGEQVASCRPVHSQGTLPSQAQRGGELRPLDPTTTVGSPREE